MRRLLLLLGLIVVSGCGDDGSGGKAASGPPPIEGVPWAMETGPSATFADGTVTGSTGCNRYHASYTLDGESIEIGKAASSLMACGPPADGIERAYLAALDRVAAWRVDGDELVLSDADGKELLRFQTASITGEWVATSYRTPSAVTSTLAGTEITAEFAADGTLSGSAGCNGYDATYTEDGGKITIAKPSATLKACAEPAGIMEQEQAYLAALPLAASYTVEGTKLSLLTAEGTYVATYERAP